MFPSLGNTLYALSFLCRWNYGNNFTLLCLSFYLLEVLKLKHCFIDPAASFSPAAGILGNDCWGLQLPRLWLRQGRGSGLIHTTPNRWAQNPSTHGTEGLFC